MPKGFGGCASDAQFIVGARRWRSGPFVRAKRRAAAELVYRLTRGRVPASGSSPVSVKQAEILGTDPALQSVAVTTEGDIVGCAMFFPLIDRTASGFARRCALLAYDRVEVKVALVQALRPLAASRGVLMLQACCDVDDAAAEEVLTRSGFEFLATMLFMERAETRSGPKCQPDNRIRWVEYTPERHADFARFIERSYEGTLDCARLGEFRDVDLTLESYRERGYFDPSLWLLGEIDGAPAAVILRGSAGGIDDLRAHVHGRGAGVSRQRLGAQGDGKRTERDGFAGGRRDDVAGRGRGEHARGEPLQRVRFRGRGPPARVLHITGPRPDGRSGASQRNLRATFVGLPSTRLRLVRCRTDDYIQRRAQQDLRGVNFCVRFSLDRSVAF